MANYTGEYLEKVGSFGVDSGQVLIVDPCYLHSITKEEYKEGIKYGWVDGNSGDDDNSYNEACQTTKGESRAGQMLTLHAVVASTGYGDGVYNVYARRDVDDRIMQLVIDFEGILEDE